MKVQIEGTIKFNLCNIPKHYYPLPRGGWVGWGGGFDKGNTVNRIRTFVYDLDQNQLLILVAGYYKGDKYEIGSIREISSFNIVKFVLKR